MNKLIVMSAFAAVAVLGPALAKAGAALDQSPVYINTSSKYAFGSMGYAYNSGPADKSVIGCVVKATSAVQPIFMCSATDSTGSTKSCSSTSTSATDFGRALGALTSSSNLLFGWDASGNCNQVQVFQASNLQQKH